MSGKECYYLDPGKDPNPVFEDAVALEMNDFYSSKEGLGRHGSFIFVFSSEFDHKK
ncbi:MAG: hypothetical protein GXO74_12880 [Calditrichaeota bacterium]|nr:hypothetical protein [Calditrichota bacterium]